MTFQKIFKLLGFRNSPASRYWWEGNYMCSESLNELYWLGFCIKSKVLSSEKILPECYKKNPQDSKMVTYRKRKIYK